jgi:hypothetical protein
MSRVFWSIKKYVSPKAWYCTDSKIQKHTAPALGLRLEAKSKPKRSFKLFYCRGIVYRDMIPTGDHLTRVAMVFRNEV